MNRRRSDRKGLRAILAMAGPWGDGDDKNGETGGSGPRNPWGDPPDMPRPRKRPPSSIEDLLRKGPGVGLPQRPDGKSWWPIALVALLGLWLALTSVHRIAPQERGVVTMFGSYARTLGPGLHLTLPLPVEQVTKVDVEEIRTVDIPTGEAEKLILTGDQNIVDLGYSVRWNIKSPELFLFQIANPEETIQEVAESAMRAVVANFTLDDAIGAERTDMEQRVTENMQRILDQYRSGVAIQGVAIKKADPPAAVNDAFKEVSAAQQTAQTYLNEARAYAQQLTAQAQGEAAAFDKVFEEYRLAPEVTRQRMYYETMERVLSNVDKTIVESGSGVTPYLPLPEVRKRAQAAAQPAKEAAQ